MSTDRGASAGHEAYARIRCRGDSVPGYCCGVVDLTEAEYSAQMSRPDSLWYCPNCGSTASFDDDYFESQHFDNELESALATKGERDRG